jgi:hypothetical protein
VRSESLLGDCSFLFGRTAPQTYFGGAKFFLSHSFFLSFSLSLSSLPPLFFFLLFFVLIQNNNSVEMLGCPNKFLTLDLVGAQFGIYNSHFCTFLYSKSTSRVNSFISSVVATPINQTKYNLSISEL